MLLTPGKFMVEHVTQSRDRAAMIYSANTGTTPNDGDRRHIFRVGVTSAQPQPVTSGDGIEWEPAAADDTHVAFVVDGRAQSAGRRDRGPRRQGPPRPDRGRRAGELSLRLLRRAEIGELHRRRRHRRAWTDLPAAEAAAPSPA